MSYVDGITTTVAAGTTSNTVITSAAGKLRKILVTSTAGAAATNVYDNASAASGTIIGCVPASAATGTLIDFSTGMPALNGITIGGAATNPAMTIVWST